MAVIICGVDKGSPADRAGIKKGDTLVSINGSDIVDVLDYRFYQEESVLDVILLDKRSRRKAVHIEKDEYDELGLEFETYLIDSQHSCRNKCIFCFIDQMPKGMRESLYFKDDDSRLSFLFGNYITLTNISEHEVQRIINMHISPVNVSVHTTNPELRCKMMNNRFAGESLSILWRLCNAGIKINTQLVLCPGYNDRDELRRTLGDLLQHESINSISSVPVGLTSHREGLTQLRPFTPNEAAEVIDIIDEYNNKDPHKNGRRRVFAGDEFYILAGKEMPGADYYGDFEQLENGVGLWSLLAVESEQALIDAEAPVKARKISIATGVAAEPLLLNIVDKASKKWHNLECKVYAVINEFFGEKITVSGLITGGDIIKQLSGKELGTELLIPSSMLRREGDVFLDDVTVEEIEKALNIKVKVVCASSGYDLISALAGNE